MGNALPLPIQERLVTLGFIREEDSCFTSLLPFSSLTNLSRTGYHIVVSEESHDVTLFGIERDASEFEA